MGCFSGPFLKCLVSVCGRVRPTQLNHTTKYLSSIGLHVSLFQVANITLRCFLHSHGNVGKAKRDYALLLSNNFKGSLEYTVS